jgi:hypothetical protein
MTNRTYAVAEKKRKVIRLNKEAFKLVEDNAVDITAALLRSTIEGKVMSTRLLVELAEGDVDVEDGMPVGPLRSLALKLALAVQSRAKVPHAVVETEMEIQQPAEV